MKTLKLFVVSFIFFINIIQNSFAFNASDSWIGEPFSGFKKTSVTKGKEYMVASADVLASKAGAWALEKGGNAIDAAIATQLVLNVVEPHSSGIGGGGFLLYYDARNHKTIYYNGRETAPAKAFEKMFLDQKGNPRAFNDVVRGGLSVGTPGLLKILKEAHNTHGNLPWKILFEPAIKIAGDGFFVNERLHILSKQITYLKNFDESAKIYLNKNKPYEIGEVIKNPIMARTLQILAKDGIDSFYNGQIAKDIVSAVRGAKINPGYLSLSDLQNYKSKKGDLICSTYRIKYKICSMPLPSSGGISVLQILGILENFDLKNLGLNSAESTHLIIEATRLAYADRNEYVADVNNAPIDQMLDKVYLRDRSRLIKHDETLLQALPGDFLNGKKLAEKKLIKDTANELPSTTHISIVDRDGNAVALTSSIEYFFGSGLSVDGFMLNNQLTDFSLQPEIKGNKVANRVQPHKQPRSSMSPTFVFDENDDLIMVLGSPGGPRIIQFTVKTIINHIDFNQDIQQAISSPNFVVLNDVVELEAGTKITKLQKRLEKLGHKTKIIEITSGINAIAINDNKITGGADPRRQGAAIGK